MKFERVEETNLRYRITSDTWIHHWNRRQLDRSSGRRVRI